MMIPELVKAFNNLHFSDRRSRVRLLPVEEHPSPVRNRVKKASKSYLTLHQQTSQAKNQQNSILMLIDNSTSAYNSILIKILYQNREERYFKFNLKK